MWSLYPTKQEKRRQARQQKKLAEYPYLKINQARRAVKDVVLALQNEEFKKEVGIKTSEVVEGGSLGQGTAVPNNYDVDLVLYSISRSHTTVVENDGYPEELKKIDSYLKKCLPNYTLIKTTKVAISFKYTLSNDSEEDLSFDLLLSPYWDSEEEYFTVMKSLSSDHERLSLFSASTSRWQRIYVQQQKQHVKDLIKRAKAWRNNVWATKEDGRIKSYPLSLLVIAAFNNVPEVDHKRKLVKYADRVTEELKKLVKRIHTTKPKELDIRIPGGKYETLTAEFPGLIDLPPLPRIVDPVNPINNIYLSGIGGTDSTKKPALRWQKFSAEIDSIDLKKDVLVIIKEGQVKPQS